MLKLENHAYRWFLSGRIQEIRPVSFLSQHLTPETFNVYLFIFFLREREHELKQGRAQRETESEEGSRLRAVSMEPDVGLELTD